MGFVRPMCGIVTYRNNQKQPTAPNWTAIQEADQQPANVKIKGRGEMIRITHEASWSDFSWSLKLPQMTSFSRLLSTFEWWLCGVTFLKTACFHKVSAGCKNITNWRPLCLCLVFWGECDACPWSIDRSVKSIYHWKLNTLNFRDSRGAAKRPHSFVVLPSNARNPPDPAPDLSQPGPVPHLVGNGEAGAQAAGSDCLRRYPLAIQGCSGIRTKIELWELWQLLRRYYKPDHPLNISQHSFKRVP